MLLLLGDQGVWVSNWVSIHPKCGLKKKNVLCLTSIIIIFMKGYKAILETLPRKGIASINFCSICFIIPVNVSSMRAGLLFILVTAVLPAVRTMLGT